jgi:hypothetical protein
LWWQDQEVGYFHGFLHGVDYVFVDAPCFHAAADNIYGGSRQVTPHAPMEPLDSSDVAFGVNSHTAC